jgi:hypothetical protein
VATYSLAASALSRLRFTSLPRLWDLAAMNSTQQLSTLTLAVRESQQPAHGVGGHGSAGGPVGALLTMIVGLAIMVIAWRRQRR